MKKTLKPALAAARGEALRLMALWGLDGWMFRFNGRKSSLGMCVYPNAERCTPGRIELSRHYAEKNPIGLVRDTILHEIAHALAGPKAGHGPAWKAWCLKVGARPERCGKAEACMPAGKWQARCGNCQFVYTRHRRPRRGRTFWCNRPGCGRSCPVAFAIAE